MAATTLDVVDTTGKKAGSVELPGAIFDVQTNVPLIHQVVTAQLAAARQGTHSTKGRGEVSGSGAKPFKQKGTGRARAGTIRSPLWRTGGKTFAAVPADYSQKVNKKMYRVALQVILSELNRQERLVVVDAFDLEQPKTRELVAKLKALGADNVLIIGDSVGDALYLAARNLRNVEVRAVGEIDPVCLVRYEKVVLTAGAAKALGEKLA